MITSVSIKGWRSHWDSELKFSDGTNALIGVMGAGKSSVLDAISFALFGTFPAVQARKLNLEDIIMTRPQKKERAEVTVEIEHGMKTYTVKRAVERGKRTVDAEIREDGKLLDAGPTKVTDFVERILKVDYDLFARAIYSEQNGLDYFLTIPKGQRMKKMDQLLKIDRFEAARSTVTTIINRIRDSVSERSRLVRDMEVREDFTKISVLQKDVNELQTGREAQEKEVERLEKEQTGVDKQLDALKEKRKELEAAEREVVGFRATAESIQQDLQGYTGDETPLRRALELAVQERALATKKEEELSERIDSAKERKQALLLEKRQLDDKIEVDGDTCPVCERPMDAEHKQKLAGERETKTKEIAAGLWASEEEVNELQKRHADIKKRIKDIEDQKWETEKKISKIAEMQDKRARLEAYKKRLDLAEKKVEVLRKGVNDELVEKLQETMRHIYGSLSKARVQAQTMAALAVEKSERLDELKKKKEQFESYKKSVERMERLTEQLRVFHAALLETQEALRKEFVVLVNGTMSDIWEELYPYEDYTDIRIAARDGDYTLELQTDGNWVPVEGFASGGERTTALLCLRMAFALVLAPNLKWLVLDEPTHNLDAQGVDYLAEVLRDKIGEFVDQVFLITHDDKLENAVTGYLYRLERAKSKNEATRVTCLVSPAS